MSQSWAVIGCKNSSDTPRMYYLIEKGTKGLCVNKEKVRRQEISLANASCWLNISHRIAINDHCI
jgi:hypothetical protein